MMTFDEMADVLGACAVFDKRKGDELDIQAWLMIAEDQRWTAPAAMRVIREHYGSGGDRPRLEPAVITDRIRKMRSQAAESFERPKIPDGMSNAEFLVYERQAQADHIDAQLARWAMTGQEPDRALPPAPNRSLAEVLASAPKHVRAEIAAAVKKIGKRP